MRKVCYLHQEEKRSSTQKKKEKKKEQEIDRGEKTNRTSIKSVCQKFSIRDMFLSIIDAQEEEDSHYLLTGELPSIIYTLPNAVLLRFVYVYQEI